MRHWFRSRLMGVMKVAGVVTLLTLVTGLAAGQGTAAYKAPRTAYGDGKPNLNGIWQAMGTAHWNLEGHAAYGPVLPANLRDLGAPGTLVALGAIGAVPAGQGVVEGEEIPYQPWAAAKKRENFEKRLMLDPEVKCYLPGIPRATYMPFPFQIVQTPTRILMAYEYASASRTIHVETVGPNPVDTWMGHSVGRWEGETLVVDVTSFNDRTWFDRAGNFHSEALHIIERYTPVSPDRLSYEVTIEDPKVFTRPWKISLPLYRRAEANLQLMEFKCVEFVEELMWGPLLRETSR